MLTEARDAPCSVTAQAALNPRELQLRYRRAKALHTYGPTVFLQSLQTFWGPVEETLSSPEPSSSVFSQPSITLTLQVRNFTVLLLLQLGIFLAMSLQCLAMFQFQAVVLQLQVKQLLLDVFMLVLNMKRGDKVSTRRRRVIKLMPSAT